MILLPNVCSHSEMPRIIEEELLVFKSVHSQGRFSLRPLTVWMRLIMNPVIRSACTIFDPSKSKRRMISVTRNTPP